MNGDWVGAHEREHHRTERAHAREHKNQATAAKLALTDLNRRLDDLNRLRAEVLADRHQFVTNAEYEARHQALINRVNALEKLLDRAEGSLSTGRFILTFVGIGGVVALGLAVFNAVRLGP